MDEEITIIAPQRVDLLADISEHLGNNNINLKSILSSLANEVAIVRLVVDSRDAKKAKKLLKEAGFEPYGAQVLIIKLRDRPGELAKVSRMLSNHKISVDYIYLINKERDYAVLAVKTSDYEKAKKYLKEYL